ncbi:MAG: Rieske iron-sulfur protein [Mucilaginibacter sp.]|nr:Rieske iron-sulfur protein [Mucilaginibacter sp.]
MERKDFLKTCGFACLAGIVPGVLLEGCGSAKMIAGTMDQTGLLVPLSAFAQAKGKEKKYIVVEHASLKYPICVYRFNGNEYSALLMRCTHQGAELHVVGDRLECPAHGSQFTNKGTVKNGPADTNLRTFPVNIQNDQLHILLK